MLCSNNLKVFFFFIIFAIFLGCKKNSNSISVNTTLVDKVDLTTASVSGNIHVEENVPVLRYGVCWASKPEPTLSDDYTNALSSSKSFVCSITDLSANTDYYVRAFAVINGLPVYGNQIRFKTKSYILFNQFSSYGTLTDIDGNVYKTIKIGSQTWMAENLKVTHYKNGDKIQNVTDQVSWNTLESGAYSFYRNDENNGSIYGGLYNWYAVDDKRGLAPHGWHVPTEEDWDKLKSHLGKDDLTGIKLKESGAAHWGKDNSYSTNESGFTALPSGIRQVPNGFNFINENAFFWTASIAGPGAWYRSLGGKWLDFSRSNANEKLGLSVRCVQD